MKLDTTIRTATGLRSATADEPTYDDAKAAIDAQVGEGEQVLSYRRLDD